MPKINLYVLASFNPLIQNMTTRQSKGHRNIPFLLCVMLSNLWVLQQIKMENGTLLTNHKLCFLQIPAHPSGFSFCYIFKEAFICTLFLPYLSEISVLFLKLENAHTYTVWYCQISYLCIQNHYLEQPLALFLRILTISISELCTDIGED